MVVGVQRKPPREERSCEMRNMRRIVLLHTVAALVAATAPGAASRIRYPPKPRGVARGREYPDGTRVAAATRLEARDRRIIREASVEVWDELADHSRTSTAGKRDG